MMKSLPTVLGNVTADQLGMTLPHEHIAVSSIPMTSVQKDGVRCIWDLVSAPLKQKGVRTVAIVYRGPRLLTANRPVKTPAQIRVSVALVHDAGAIRLGCCG
jgi:hypothetical protein